MLHTLVRDSIFFLLAPGSLVSVRVGHADEDALLCGDLWLLKTCLPAIHRGSNSTPQRNIRIGGWEKAISEAMKRCEGFERDADADNSSPGTSSSSTLTPELSDSASSPYAQVPTTSVLRNRLVRATRPTSRPDEKPKDLTPHVSLANPGLFPTNCIV